MAEVAVKKVGGKMPEITIQHVTQSELSESARLLRHIEEYSASHPEHRRLTFFLYGFVRNELEQCIANRGVRSLSWLALFHQEPSETVSLKEGKCQNSQ